MALQRWAARAAIALSVGALLVLVGAGARALASPARQGGIPLTVGEPVSGTLTDEIFRQVYTFDGEAEEVVTLHMERTDGDLDPYLLLTDEQGTILGWSDDDGATTDALITLRRLPAAGRYFVIATRFGQEHGSTTGQYRLLLERVGVSDSGTASLQYGETAFDRVTPERPLVFYFLRAERGDVLDITMKRTSGNLDPHLDFATADGRILMSNDDDPLAEGTLDAAITDYTVLESGVYLVVATRFGREAGDTQGSYMLSLAQVPPEELGTAPDNPRLIDYGSTLDGTISDDLPLRYYWFDARRGDVITVSLTAEGSNLNPLVKLLAADGTELVRDDDSGDNGRDARIAAFTIPAAGRYLIVATRAHEAEGQTEGAFALQLNGRPGIAGGQMLEIAYGATVSGLIDAQNSAEEYVFFGRQGDEIQVSMQRASGDLDSLVTLFDSTRKQVTFDDDGGGDKDAQISGFVLPRDDMYILLASRYDREQGTTAGAYILNLKLVRSRR